MKRAALLVVGTLALNGCATTAALVRPQRVSLPLLIGATIADLVVVGLASAQLKDFSAGAVIATTVAATATDVGVSCLLGGCSVLRP